jgi:transcriptional regulator with XRE-family HTH domain
MKKYSVGASDLDARFDFLTGHIDKLSAPEGGWLRTVRDGIGLSQREAAALAGVTQQAFDQFESGELRASITLERLQKAAAALGCEVVYFLRPSEESGGSFAALAEQRFRKPKPSSTENRVDSRRNDEELPVNLL